MRWPGRSLPTTILLRARHLVTRNRPADPGALPPSDDGEPPSDGGEPPTDGSADTTISPAPATGSTAGSDQTTPAGNNDANGRGWAALARRRHMPSFVRRYAQRRQAAIEAQAVEQYSGRHDADDNRDTRIPDGEQVRVPVIWLTELYTPTTLDGLVSGLPRLMAKAGDQHPERGDIVEWVKDARRRGGGSWRMLSNVLPAGSGVLSPDRITDDLPGGVASVTLGIYTLTSTVTAVTAAFRVREEHAGELLAIVNQDVSTRSTLLPGGSYKISDVRWQKRAAAERWSENLRGEAARWLAERLPGSFHSLDPGQPPTIELLLTEQQRPWDRPAAGTAGSRGWTHLLDLEDLDEYWQCITMPWLRLRERRFHGWNPGPRHLLTLAGLRPDLLAAFPAAHAATENAMLDQAIYLLHLHVVPLANRWALTALLHELDEQLAETRDLAERATGKRSPRALTQVQRQLISIGLDSQIVAADIVRYASDERSWRYDVLDFSQILPPALTEHLSPAPAPEPSLAESLRQGQLDHGATVTQNEADMRDLISSSAQLTAAAENIRLQRRVSWLTVVSLIVAAIAAAAAIAALHNSGNAPAPAPAVRPSVSQTQQRESSTPSAP